MSRGAFEFGAVVPGDVAAVSIPRLLLPQIGGEEQSDHVKGAFEFGAVVPGDVAAVSIPRLLLS
jgi:hypothetical protein